MMLHTWLLDAIPIRVSPFLGRQHPDETNNYCNAHSELFPCEVPEIGSHAMSAHPTLKPVVGARLLPGHFRILAASGARGSERSVGGTRLWYWGLLCVVCGGM